VNNILENYGVEILDSNVNNVNNLFDNKFSTVITEQDINTGDDHIYLKISCSEVQYFSFHNIYGGRVEIAIFDKDGNPKGDKTSSVVMSAARGCFDVLNRKRLFTKNNILVEFDKATNTGGYAEIKIHKLCLGQDETLNDLFDETLSLGGFAIGFPIVIGKLHWEYTEETDIRSLPAVDEDFQITGDNIINTYEKKVRMNADIETVTEKSFVQDSLDRLSTKMLEEYTVRLEDGGTKTAPKWVGKKVTFIDVFTREVLWAEISSYKFTMKGPNVIIVNVELKGFKR